MGEELATNESVLSHLPRVAAAATEYIVGAYPQSHLVEIVGDTESPIEAIFALWWEVMYPIVERRRRIRLHQQFGFAPINGRTYRADFVIWPSDLDEMSRANALGVEFHAIVIELDGHDYHERTREQVTQRNQRDRDFQDKGYLVLHFSGSELHRDPYQVFADVFMVAAKEWARYADAHSAARLAKD